MARHSYKTALRAKGIRPIPPYHKLRSFKDGDQAIDATGSQVKEVSIRRVDILQTTGL